MKRTAVVTALCAATIAAAPGTVWITGTERRYSSLLVRLAGAV